MENNNPPHKENKPKHRLNLKDPEQQDNSAHDAFNRALKAEIKRMNDAFQDKVDKHWLRFSWAIGSFVILFVISFIFYILTQKEFYSKISLLFAMLTFIATSLAKLTAPKRKK